MAINTGIGTAIGIPFKRYTKKGEINISPELLDSLCGVWIADQNTNESPTRNIIKNKLKDKGGDFKILNAAYKLNSGYGLYKEDFSSRLYLYEGVNASHNRISLTDSALKNTLWIANRYNDIKDSYYVNITGIPKNGTLVITSPWTILYNGLNKIETSGIESETLGFRISEDSINLDWSKLVIEQIPDYQGAFITDGVDDLIVSKKPVSDMLGGSNEITVISMIHQIELNSTYNKGYTNVIEGIDDSAGYLRNTALQVDNTGIYGYTYNGLTQTLINNILGDKNDYEKQIGNNLNVLRNSCFNPIGGINNKNYHSSAAWYWTIIAKRVLTSDEINQVIAYFNLDKYVKPDIYYNVKKQGITNDNHDKFGDKLIDYSGNGRDMQLYNIVWAINSGIGDYPVSLATRVSVSSLVDKSIFINQSYFKITNPIEKDSIDALEIQYTNYQTLIYTNAAINSEFKLRITSLPKNGKFRINPDNYGQNNVIVVEKDGIYNVARFNGTFAIYRPNEIDYTGLKIELVPEYEGALVLDGVNDFGKVEGLPILKDYTVVGDYQRLVNNNDRTGGDGPLLSKSYTPNKGAFVFNARGEKVDTGAVVYSFGTTTYNPNINDMDRNIFYQTKYKNQDFNINVGSGIDGDSMVLGTFRSGDPRFASIAMYSAMLFPYSLSKFLISRQLIKHKLITNMVIFLPILDINNYIKVEYYTEDLTTKLELDKYFPKGYNFVIKIWMPKFTDIIKATFQNTDCIVVPTNDNDISSDSNNSYYIHCVNVKTYAQMIHIETEEYLKFEDIGQPYPCIFRFYDKHTNEKYDYGSYIKKGSVIKVDTITILLPKLYNVNGYVYDGHTYNYTKIKNKEFIVGTNNLIFKTNVTYKLGNPPKVIYSIKALPLTNDIYKYLGYIPDLSGNNNHGYLYNIGYITESGLDAANKVFSLDGVSDYIRINNLKIGGRQILLNFDFLFNALIFDERYNSDNNGAIYVGGNNLAHNFRNVNGNTYINGELNTTIISMNLRGIKHIAIVTNPLDINVNSTTPVIGANKQADNYFSKTKFDTFMLFDEIDTAENIKQLNDIVDSIGGGSSDYIVDFQNGH